MSATVLKLAANTEPFAEKVRRLREEAQSYALDHSRVFETAIAELLELAADIAEGGEAYPVGVREEARRLAPELTRARLNVTSLLDRKN